jgi:hypothetical protein
MLRASAAALASCVLASCAWHAPGLVCADTDTACLAHALAAHPVRSVDFWKADLARPVAERIGSAPPQLVEFITLDNVKNGFPERPRPAAMDAGFTQDLRDAFAELPAEVRRLFDDRLVGVYLVDSLGGTGYTDAVLDAQGKQVAGMVVLDASVLKQRTANGWATWKENTPFKRDERFRLQALIENEAHDNRKNAIQYILLHELGHVLSIGGNIHPPWNGEPKDVGATAGYGYFNLSWRIDTGANRYVTLFDGEFAQRRNVAYYFGAKLGAEDMVPTYASLVKTNFPTLYAATHPGDDFAEAFASYVHVVMMGRPWRITLSRGAEVVSVVDSCWQEARCAAKRKLLEQLLGRLD